MNHVESEHPITRTWLRYHKFSMPPTEFRKLVTDPTHGGKDYIMDHPDMKEMMRGVTELPGGGVVHFG
jgi:hypothetical protein